MRSNFSILNQIISIPNRDFKYSVAFSGVFAIDERPVEFK